MITEDPWLLPEGIEEVLPDEALKLERLRRTVLDLFASWGYRQVIPPLIEYIESLLTGTGSDLDLQTFKLIDQVSGRLLGVRADMTPQVARIDARHADHGWPNRLCYIGTVLHTRADHLETSRSPMQVGAELYGHEGRAADFEIIRLMLAMFESAGVGGVHLDLGHVGIYRTLARQTGLNPEQEVELFDILQRKARPELDNFLSSIEAPTTSASMLRALTDLHGGTEVLNEARQYLSAAGEAIRGALDDLEEIALRLHQDFPDLPLHFDLAELRGYHFHTGLVFAAFVPGYGREVARGGRYDEIGKVFGKARPATGFSADLKVLMRLGTKGTDDHAQRMVFAPHRDDPQLLRKIDELRHGGWIVIRELPGQHAGAAAMGCHFELRCQENAWDMVRVGE